MKVIAFCPEKLAKRITLIEVRPQDVPLRVMFDRWCISADLRPPEPDDMMGERPYLGDFVFRSGRRTAKGFLVHDGTDDLVDFLMRHVRRVGMPDIDEVLAESGPGRHRALRRTIEAIDNEVPAHRRVCGAFACANAPFLSSASFADALHRHLLRVDLGDVRVFLRKKDDTDAIVFHRDVRESHHGHLVPRRRFVCCSKDWIGRGMEGKQAHLVCWDGESLRVVSDLHHVPDQLLRDLERGTARAAEERELLPRLDLSPVALLHVPRQREARRVLNSSARVLRKRPRLRGTGYLVFETTEPIALPSSVPVVTDCEEVLSILGRTRNRVYVREDLPDLESCWFRDRPYWVSLARVMP